MRVDMQESQSQSWNNTTLFRLLPVRNWTIASTGINPHPTGVREEAELDCVAEGFITSVSHEPRGAAAAFTDCVISLRAFHTVKLPTVFRQETLFFFLFFSFRLRGGAGAVFQKPRRMHKHKRAQVKVELFKWMITMEGRWKDSRQDHVWKQQHGGGNILESYRANHLVCPDRVSVCRLLIWPPVIWVVNSSAVYIQLSFEKRIPVLYEVEFSDVY